MWNFLGLKWNLSDSLLNNVRISVWFELRAHFAFYRLDRESLTQDKNPIVTPKMGKKLKSHLIFRVEKFCRLYLTAQKLNTINGWSESSWKFQPGEELTCNQRRQKSTFSRQIYGPFRLSLWMLTFSQTSDPISAFRLDEQLSPKLHGKMSPCHPPTGMINWPCSRNLWIMLEEV